MKKFRVAS